MKDSILPGLALTTAIAIAAFQLHKLPFAPFTVGGRHPIDALLIAILLGLAARNLLPLGPSLGEGIKVSVKKVLPFAIVLMGAKLDFFDVLRVSAQALWISVLCVVVAFGLTLWLCRRAGVDTRLGILIGIGTAICGGTAIVVAAPTIEAEEKDTAFAIATITLFGVGAIFAFPLLGHALQLTQTEFGIWAGVAIQATPQVMAAGFAYGPEAGEIAVIVKLVRVLLLAPMVIGLGWWYARQKRAQQQAHVAQKTPLSKLFPPFILGFLALAVANTLNLLPDFTLHLQQSALWEAGDRQFALSQVVTTVSGFLIVVAMAGVGCGVHVKSLLGIGLKGLYVGMFAAVVLAGFSLAMLKLMG